MEFIKVYHGNVKKAVRTIHMYFFEEVAKLIDEFINQLVDGSGSNYPSFDYVAGLIRDLQDNDLLGEEEKWPVLDALTSTLFNMIKDHLILYRKVDMGDFDIIIEEEEKHDLQRV